MSPAHLITVIISSSKCFAIEKLEHHHTRLYRLDCDMEFDLDTLKELIDKAWEEGTESVKEAYVSENDQLITKVRSLHNT